MSFSPVLGNPKPYFPDSNGDPYVGMRLFFYYTDTSTKADTQTDSTGLVDNTNPVVIGADGYPTGDVMIYGANNTGYKVVAAPPGSDDPPTSPLWTINKIYPGATVDGEWINPLAATRASTTTFTIAGVDKTTEYHAGKRIKCTGGADVYTEVVNSTFSTDTTVTTKHILNASMDTVYEHIENYANTEIIPTLADLKAIQDNNSHFVYVLGRSSTDDGYQGQFYWDASDLSARVTLDTTNGLYVPPDSDNTGSSGCWVRMHSRKRLQWEWFYTTDIGIGLNNAIKLYPDYVGMYGGFGKFTCSTQIDLDNATGTGTVVIRGSGVSPTTDYATIIDGSAMSIEVMIGGRSKDNYQIDLRDFVIQANSSADGLLLGDQASGYSISHGYFDNIMVNGGAPGMRFEFGHNCWINKLYSVQADGNGIEFDTMNATHCGIITVRQATGTALDWEKGLSFTVDKLYLESNVDSALRIWGDCRSSKISSLYLEGNNTGTAAAYEVRLGDSGSSTEDIEGFQIENIYMSPPSSDFTAANIGVEYSAGVTLGNLWANGASGTLFEFIGANAQIIKFSNWSVSSTPIIDLSAAGPLSNITFDNCDINPTDFVFPSNSTMIDFVGCDRLLERLQNYYLADTTGGTSYDLMPWELNSVIDTDNGIHTQTLPPAAVSLGKIYTITNVGGSANNITVDTSGAETIQGSASITIADGISKSFRYEHNIAQWMIVADTT